MTQDEVIALAREAGDDWDHTLPDDREFLIRFANLVLASRKPLTDEQIWDAYMGISAEFDCNVIDLVEFTRAIESAHGITGDKT